MFFIRFWFLITFLFSFDLIYAQSEITVSDIWQEYKFYDELLPSFNFQNDGKHYTLLDWNKIRQYDLTTGAATNVIFDAEEVKNNPIFNGRVDDYTFSDDENKILIKTETQQIFRRSTTANFYVWDCKHKTLTAVSEAGKQRYATFSPSADKLAFVRENNLFYKDLKGGNEIQITTDGKYNEIINGASDWVYEEEFRVTKAFEWSPDGKKIAYLKFDETRVKEFTMQLFRGGMYPENVTFKYPKVGEENAVVNIFIYDIEKGETVKVDIGSNSDIYVPRIVWTHDDNALCVFKLNRHQNELELLIANAKNGAAQTLLKETNKYYIDLHDHLTFMQDDKHFLWTSERDGFNHLYLYDLNGKLKKQLTEGAFDVTDFYGYDHKKDLVYFQAAINSPMQRQVCSVDLKGNELKILTPVPGTNNALFSSTFEYYINTHSTANTPPSYTVFNNNGEKIRLIKDNLPIQQLQTQCNTQPVKFFTFTTSEGVDLNGWKIYPPDFDSLQQYPVFMYVYGGPGSQLVLDQYGGQNYWWFQMLAQKGYIVVCVDNRGTGARGQEFKKMTYMQLGKYETIDQIEAAKYLVGLPYTDDDRIGIFGWSYGAYVSLLCLFKGSDIFKSAIAVAPVANWKWYDTVYTERYMRTLEENPDGYKNNSPLNFVQNLKGKLLLVHGTGDDNVHFQNTVELTETLIRADKHFDTYFYPNRNHSIFGANARHHLYTKMTNFLLENL